MKWFTKKQAAKTEVEPEPGGLMKKWQTFIRMLKITVQIIVASAILFVLALAVVGGYFIFAADRYTLAYVVAPGEVVTVVKVTPDYVFTSWLGRSHPDPRILVRKDNGWERNFPAKNGDENFRPGDRLVMTKGGEFVVTGKPFPQMVMTNHQMEPVPYEDTGSLIPVATPAPTPSPPLKKSEINKIKDRVTSDNVACNR